MEKLDKWKNQLNEKMVKLKNQLNWKNQLNGKISSIEKSVKWKNWLNRKWVKQKNG